MKTIMRKRAQGTALASILVWGWACQQVDRSLATETETASAEPGGADAGSVAPPAPPTDPSGGEMPPDVQSLDPGAVGDQSGLIPAACTDDAGVCTPGDAGGAPAVCVPTGPRDCSSSLDNDCDGLPDNTADDVCRCVPAAVESCEEHPGFDGLGLCRAGARTCVLVGDGGIGTDWGACEGAVGPGEADSCTIAGDDTDCDGVPNEGCTCINGQTQQCGSTTDIAGCAFGTSTCVNAAFGECIGAVPPAPRDTCVAGDDSNCNGTPNEGCTCINGETRQCGSTDTGPCSFGTETCVNGTFGACQGAVTPAARDTCADGNDSNCNGTPNEGCACINGETQPCGTDVGVCALGTQTCTNGSFGAQCVGAINPGPRNCGSAQDNDCNGEPDNTIDGVCECVPGGGNGPCSDDPRNSRCNSQGQCAPCEANADCALVAGGLIECVDGQCVAPAIPLDCTTALPALASGAPTTLEIAGPPPEPQGGEILEGVYVKTEVRFYDGLSEQSVPSSTIRIQAGTFMQRIGEFDSPIGGRQPGSVTAGSLVTSGSSASFETSTCVNQRPSGTRTNTVGYDASPTRLLIHRAGLVEVFDIE